MGFGRQNKVSTDIEDYYSIKVRSIWAGLKQESAAFWWLCIYVFFEYVRPQSIYRAIDILPWAQITLLLAIITAFNEKNLTWVKNTENSFFITFFIIIIFSSIFAFHPFTSWSKFNTALNWLIIYFLIINIVNTEKRFLVFILLFLLVNFKMSQHGFRSFASRGFSFAGWGVKGAPGWFQNSGEFGIAMTIFVPLSIAFIAALKAYWGHFKRLFFYLFPLTGLVTIAATSSRGAQVAIAGVGLWFLLKSRVGLKAFLGILVFGYVLYMVIPAEQMERFQTMGEDKTSESRLIYWSAGTDVIGDHPLLGVGYANWIDYCWYLYPNGLGITPRCIHVHNTYIEAAAELGISGLLVFLMMVLFVFIMNARTRRNAKKSDNKFILYIAHGLDGGMVGLLISGTFISVLFYPFFWFQMAMTVALHEISRKQVSTNQDKVDGNFSSS